MARSWNLEAGRSRTIFNWIFWLGIALQAGLAILISKPWMTGDSQFYLGLANAIDQGFYGWAKGGLVEPDALRPPGYPLMLSLLLHRLNMSVATVVALQMGLYLACIMLIDLKLRAGGFGTICFRLLAMIYPFGAIYCGFVMTEAWAMFALTCVALLVSADQLSTPRLALAGLITGIATLFRSDLLLLPLVIAMVVVARDWSFKSVTRMVWRALLPLLAAAVVLTPYALWNARNFERLSPIPVASAVGNSLYLATWQGRVPLDDLNALYRGVVTPRVEESGLASEIRTLNASFGANPLTPPFNPAAYPTSALQRQSSAVFGQAARQRILADPAGYGGHVLRNVWALWNTSAYPAIVPAVGRWGLALISGLIFLAGMTGVLVAFRRRLEIGAAGLILLYPMIIHLPLHTEARYTAAARPLLLMFAALAVTWLVKRYRTVR